MKTRLSWSIVKEHFSDQWIELADYRWDWEAPHPAWVVVGGHAAERAELLLLIADRSEPDHQIVHQKSVPRAASAPSEDSELSRPSLQPTEPVILYVGATHTISTPLSPSV